MNRLVKVDHVVLTLKIAPAGAGMTKAEVDDLVNKRLGEGYTDVEIFPVKTNVGERADPTDLVQLYVFKQYAEEAEKATAKAGRPKKSEQADG